MSKFSDSRTGRPSSEETSSSVRTHRLPPAPALPVRIERHTPLPAEPPPAEPAPSYGPAPSESYMALSEDLYCFIQNGSITDINPAGAALLGYAAPEEILNAGFADLCATDDTDKLTEMVGYLLETGDPVEMDLKRRDGTAFPARVSALFVEDGENFSYAVRAHDLEREKQAEIRRQNAEKRADKLTGVDSTTGLTNMFLFEDRLERAIIRATRAAFGRPQDSPLKIAILALDLDNFSSVVEEYGEKARNFILRTIGMRLASSLRQKDTIASGREDLYLVILEDLTTYEDIEIVARRTLGLMYEDIVYEGDTLDIGASIGISVFPESGLSVGELVQRGLAALQAVKEDGGGHYRIFSPEMPLPEAEEVPELPGKKPPTPFSEEENEAPDPYRDSPESESA